MRGGSALAVLAAAAAGVYEVLAIDNGLGRTPPMGWRSWNLYGHDIDQALMLKSMDGMVSRKRQVDGKPMSLCDLGYCDVGLDDWWQDCTGGAEGYNYHDEAGRPVVNTTRFPNMTAMTEYAHKLGLTAGWYANNCHCKELKNATMQMYQQDVHYLTDVFQFDAVKLDGCGKEYDLDIWANLINKTGRKIMIENCHWGHTVPNSTWCPWNFFRTSGDIQGSYGSMVGNLQTTISWAQSGLSRPGCWGYPDMLEVGVQHGSAPGIGFSTLEWRSHFGAWCIVSSPLVLSHDTHNDTIMDTVWPFIANPEAIAVNQAWADHSGSPFKQASVPVAFDDFHHVVAGVLTPHNTTIPSWQYFSKPLGAGKVAVLMMNHDAKAQMLQLALADVPGLHCGGGCRWRDVWSREDLPAPQGELYEKLVESHDSVFLVLSAAAASAVVV